jgi:hypothetical protein
VRPTSVFCNGWNDAFALRLASNLGKLHWKHIKCSKQLLVTVLKEEHRLLSGFLNSNMGKIWFKIVSIQVSTPHVAQMKM